MFSHQICGTQLLTAPSPKARSPKDRSPKATVEAAPVSSAKRAPMDSLATRHVKKGKVESKRPDEEPGISEMRVTKKAEVPLPEEGAPPLKGKKATKPSSPAPEPPAIVDVEMDEKPHDPNSDASDDASDFE